MQAETHPHLPVNHVFVDMENVKSLDAPVPGGKNLRFYLFFGPQHKKLDIGWVERLFENSQSVMMVRSPLTRKNALDFVLAYHLGQAVQTDPNGFFHIIAPDKGYESLVDLLKSRNVKVKRHGDWSTLNFQVPTKPAATVATGVTVTPKARPTPKPLAKPKVSAMPTLSDGAAKVIENLKKLANAKRPKKEKTLIAHAMNFTGKDKPDAEAGAIRAVGELKRAKLIAVDEKGAVSYKL